VAGDPRIVRMFPDYPAAEADWFRRSGIFPIMHVVVVKRALYERHRWVALNLLKALEEAKDRSLARCREMALSYFPIPWLPERAAEAEAMMGRDFWPYGIEANRRTLDAFTRWAFEQGVCETRLDVDAMFAPETRSRFKV
jgi:4,5-dihydroxyphthalate decarboxylase